MSGLFTYEQLMIAGNKAPASIDLVAIEKYIKSLRTEYTKNKKGVQDLQRAAYKAIKSGTHDSIRIEKKIRTQLDGCLQNNCIHRSMASKWIVADSLFFLLRKAERQIDSIPFTSAKEHKAKYLPLRQIISALDELIAIERHRHFIPIVCRHDPSQQKEKEALGAKKFNTAEEELLDAIGKHSKRLEDLPNRCRELAVDAAVAKELSFLAEFFLLARTNPMMIRVLSFKLKHIMTTSNKRNEEEGQYNAALVDFIQLLLNNTERLLIDQRRRERKLADTQLQLIPCDDKGNLLYDCQQIDEEVDAANEKLHEYISNYQKKYAQYRKGYEKGQRIGSNALCRLKLFFQDKPVNDFFEGIHYVNDGKCATTIYKNVWDLVYLSDLVLTAERYHRPNLPQVSHKTYLAVGTAIADFDQLVVPVMQLCSLTKETAIRLDKLDTESCDEVLRALLQESMEFQKEVNNTLASLVSIYKKGKIARVQQLLSQVKDETLSLQQLRRIIKIISKFGFNNNKLLTLLEQIMPRLSNRFQRMAKNHADNPIFQQARDDFIYVASTSMVIKNWSETIQYMQQAGVEIENNEIQEAAPPPEGGCGLTKKKKAKRKAKKKKASKAPQEPVPVILAASQSSEAIEKPNTEAAIEASPAAPLELKVSDEPSHRVIEEATVAVVELEKPLELKKPKKKEKREKRRMPKEEMVDKALQAIEKNDYNEDLYRIVKEQLRTTHGDYRKILPLFKFYGLMPLSQRGSHVRFVLNGDKSQSVLISKNGMPHGTENSVTKQLVAAITHSQQQRQIPQQSTQGKNNSKSRRS